MFNPCDFQNKKILITGASSGIGRATAIYMSKLGAKIVLNGRNIDRLKQTFKSLEGNEHKIVQANLTNEIEIKNLFETACEDGFKLDGLVHCAGIPYVVPLRLLDKNHLNEIMNNNFYSFVELVRYYAKKKNNNKGNIVVLSSILSVKPREFELGYISSKAAINAAVGTMACELAHQGIRVNGILLGNVMTEMAKKSMERFNNENKLNNIVSQSLLGWGQPEDIAPVIAFLLSDMSKVITGRMIYADGGLL